MQNNLLNQLLLFMSFLFFFGIVVAAETEPPPVVDCAETGIANVYLSDYRSDGELYYSDPAYSNKLYVDFDQETCDLGDHRYRVWMGYIDMTEPASAGMLAMITRLQKITKKHVTGQAGNKPPKIIYSVDTTAPVLGYISESGYFDIHTGSGETKNPYNYKIISIKPIVSPR